MFDSHDTLNIIYSARSNTCHPPFSPNIAPATEKKLSWIDPCHTWNLIYIGRSNTTHPATSPKIVPATKNDCHYWSSSRMKGHQITTRGPTEAPLQHHQILPLPRKIPLMIHPCQTCNVMYIARSTRTHPPTSPKILPATKNDSPKCDRNLPKTAETSFTMRGRSETVPTMIREWSDHNPRMNPSVRNPQRNWGLFSRARRELSRSGVHSKFHQVLRLPGKLAVDIHQIVHLPRKVTVMMDPCAEQQKSPSEVTKYCTCHEKLLSWWILVTKEMSCAMRGATEVTLWSHQILHLPRKITLMIDPPHIWDVIYNVRSNRNHPPKSKYCACHAKWLSW